MKDIITMIVYNACKTLQNTTVNENTVPKASESTDQQFSGSRHNNVSDEKAPKINDEMLKK